jgi:hypothetical protein
MNESAEVGICSNCGMAHEPDEPEKCIEGHGEDTRGAHDA